MIVDMRGNPIPQTKPKRTHAPARFKNYPAGVQTRLAEGWKSSAQSIDQIIHDQLCRLRARSRQQYAANPYARRFVNLCKNNVVGPNGISLQSRVKDPDGSMDTGANEAVEAVWKDYSRGRHFDAAGQVSLAESLELAVSNTAIDGEVFCRLWPGRSGGKYGLSTQFIDPELIPVSYNPVLNNGNYVRFGIEYNNVDRPVAYYRAKVEPRTHGLQTDATVAREYERIPASRMIHLYQREYVGQRRGIPWTATGLELIYSINDYVNAAITNARVGASKMGFYRTETGTRYEADGEDEEGVLVQNAEPGTFEPLPQGVSFESWDPAYPTGDFSPFMERMLRGVASAFNISYNSLANDLNGVNFSSIRSAVLEDREIWKGMQRWLIENFLQPLYERWILIQLIAGRIEVMGRPVNPERVQRFNNPHWQARRWAWVDPQKDIASSVTEIENGLKSRSQHIRDKGDDPQEVWQEIARERELMESIGAEVAGGNTVQDQAAGAGDEGAQDTQGDE